MCTPWHHYFVHYQNLISHPCWFFHIGLHFNMRLYTSHCGLTKNFPYYLCALMFCQWTDFLWACILVELQNARSTLSCRNLQCSRRRCQFSSYRRWSPSLSNQLPLEKRTSSTKEVYILSILISSTVFTWSILAVDSFTPWRICMVIPTTAYLPTICLCFASTVLSFLTVILH